MPHGPAGLAFDKWHGWSASDTAASTSVLIVIPNHVDPRVWLALLMAGQIRPFGLKRWLRGWRWLHSRMRLLGCERETSCVRLVACVSLCLGLCLR
jgi:hypothetical protein